MELHATDTVAVLYDKGEWAFEQAFKQHFKALHAYACTIVRNDATAEELVQNVFVRLWEKSDRIDIKQSLAAYLYRSVYHESLNHLKHQKVKTAYQTYSSYHMSPNTEGASRKLLLRDLEEKLDQALQSLPEQCRTIFQMSRFEELKYHEIAGRLGISVKTVENQMGKALRLLRLKLVDFLPMLLLFLLNL
ncbi:RNA polymerase sigma-70 factor [Deminuibacter soli]|uniref:RNA polymerase sigma-70 factor n=1 Tax=Deminuibacter soli TaxID=2291815 RepID=A0A3E1NHF0_9BACT|nr:RNA polymerase sigma-70 factor [Deminuibacter soli]RFM27379.1 RNA polymerase sigma-70 factor [Deminuibacter soli]